MRRLDEHLGGADTYRTYAVELEETPALIRDASYTQETGRRLAGVFAEQAQQAGWAAVDAGSHARADQLYRVSLDAARTAGDSGLPGNALALLAYQQSATGRDSVDTAAAAYREAGPDAPSGARVLLAQRLAWAHAAVGQPRAVQQALDIAQGHLDNPDGAPIPYWAAWADEREQRIIAGRCWSELGRSLRAVPILETVLAEYEDSHARDKALYLTWLATAYADAGEVEAAAVTTARALDLSADIASARPAKRAAVVLQRLEQRSAGTARARRRLALRRGGLTQPSGVGVGRCGKRGSGDLRVVPRVFFTQERLEVRVRGGSGRQHELVLLAFSGLSEVPEHGDERPGDLGVPREPRGHG